MRHPTPEQRRPVDLFDDLPDSALEAWAAAAELREFPAGEIVAEQGVVAPAVHLVLAGSIDAIAVGGDGQEEPAGVHTAPTWIGAIASLTGGLTGVRMQTATEVTIAAIEPPEFIDLVLAHRPVFTRIMSQVRPVVSRITALEQKRERLASLGTMAAGLAHELNNPASAARRAAGDLAEALEVVGSTIGHFVESGIERAEAAQLVELQREALERHAERGPLQALDASASTANPA